MAVMSPLAAALSMQQPIMPSSRAQIAPTDVLGAYQLSTNAANQQYLAKLQQQNALWGGLAGLGGSALTASILKGWNPFSALTSPAAADSLGSAATGAGGLAGADLPFASAPGFASSILPSDLAATGATAAGGAAAGGAADAAFGAGTSAVPWLAADAGTDALGADAAGTVGADLAATAAPAAADAGAASLADLLPFLFA